MSVSYIAQGLVDISGFSSLLFLFLGLSAVGLAIAVSLVVIKVVLDLIGLDLLGIIGTVFRKG